MEFEEMKKIWDSQNNEVLYGINEKALHNRILSKKRQANHITNATELILIVTNATMGCVFLGISFTKPSTNSFVYLLAAWTLASALYMLVSRTRRRKADGRFDRSMHGDLKHAISVATYQVRISLLGRWNILPIGILVLLSVWDSGKSIWVTLAVLGIFVLASFAAGWEHRIYQRKKRELEMLQNKLESEDSSDRPS